MADTTAIAWTRSVFNSWVGCTKISPGCDGCYAEALDKRFRLGGATHWGAGVPRYRTSAANWAKPLAWNKAAPTSEFAGRRGFWPVFCGSMCDVFDNEVPLRWREDLWGLIKATPNLSWLLTTKRIGNVYHMVPGDWRSFRFPDNVRIIITVVNQEEADRDIPKLLALPCKNGVSYEPALGPVDWMPFLAHEYRTRNGDEYCGQDEPCGICGVKTNGNHHPYASGINWIIPGGKSSQPGHPARPFDVEWARSTIAQCKEAGVPCFFKQAGSNPMFGDAPLKLKNKSGAALSELPVDLQIQEFPNA